MSKYVVVLVLTFLGVLLIATPSRSDVPATSPPTPAITPAPEAAPEPITGTAEMPAPGFATTPKDPFQPYGIGPTGATKQTPKPSWSYDDLLEAEKVVVDHNRDVTGWDKIHAAYNTAVQEQAQRAATGAAANQLGVHDLTAIGVVP